MEETKNLVLTHQEDHPVDSLGDNLLAFLLRGNTLVLPCSIGSMIYILMGIFIIFWSTLILVENKGRSYQLKNFPAGARVSEYEICVWKWHLFTDEVMPKPSQLSARDTVKKESSEYVF